MPQPRSATSSWSRKPIVEIPSEQWTRWLDPERQPSPYWVPEWALFWAHAWPKTTAEVWQSGEIGITTVRRQRLGRTWVYALPYGTPGGWLGEIPPGTDENGLLSDFVTTSPSRHTVEVALSVNGRAPDVKGWTRTIVESQTWIIDKRGATSAELELDLSDSHRRNIEKGAALSPEIRPVTDSREALQLFEVWPVPSEHPSRIVLNPNLATALTTAFALSHTLRWRTAWIGEKPLATTLWLVLHDRAVYVDGATVRNRHFTGVSHRLFHHILSELYREGIRHFDLGSGPQGKSAAGLVQFKEGWGGKSETRKEVIYRRPWYHRLRKIV